MLSGRVSQCARPLKCIPQRNCSVFSVQFLGINNSNAQEISFFLLGKLRVHVKAPRSWPFHFEGLSSSCFKTIRTFRLTLSAWAIPLYCSWQSAHSIIASNSGSLARTGTRDVLIFPFLPFIYCFMWTGFVGMLMQAHSDMNKYAVYSTILYKIRRWQSRAQGLLYTRTHQANNNLYYIFVGMRDGYTSYQSEADRWTFAGK